MRYVCSVCGYVYDESQSGAWASLPEDWSVPCAVAAKHCFPLSRAAAEIPEAKAAPSPDDDMRELVPHGLSALCSNLARGCEKQYKPEEAPPSQRSQTFQDRCARRRERLLDALLQKINEDLDEGYPRADAVATAAGGPGRAAQSRLEQKGHDDPPSLLSRSQSAGSPWRKAPAFLSARSALWFIRDTPPEICPVCKVTSRKFEGSRGD